MRRCDKCKTGLMQRSVKPEHVEDLGGVVVKIMNAVKVFKCTNTDCGEEVIGIPDMQGLVRAAAVYRALDPARLTGKEVRFMRRALDMTQAEFGKAMDLSPEHVSRWETGARGTGCASEKLVRHNLCALLYKDVLALDYDPSVIANMQFEEAREEDAPPEPMEMQRVLVKHDHHTTNAWDMAA
jgi:putative zinc finger/helix-turn-helix YgiT family protein